LLKFYGTSHYYKNSKKTFLNAPEFTVAFSPSKITYRSLNYPNFTDPSLTPHFNPYPRALLKTTAHYSGNSPTPQFYVITVCTIHSIVTYFSTSKEKIRRNPRQIPCKLIFVAAHPFPLQTGSRTIITVLIKEQTFGIRPLTSSLKPQQIRNPTSAKDH
jgi:hypothetical protein